MMVEIFAEKVVAFVRGGEERRGAISKAHMEQLSSL